MKVVVLLSALIAFSSFADDIQNGKKVWKKVSCTLCHKADGTGMAKKNGNVWEIKSIMTGPQIAGLSEAYIITQMTAIKEGTRYGGDVAKFKFAKDMQARLKKANLTDKDIADVAAYVSKELNKKAGTIKGMLE